MEKQIKLTIEQAKILYKSNPEYRDTLLSVFTDKELGIEPSYPKSWNDLERLDGFFIDDASNINNLDDFKTYNDTKNIFATRKQAKSALAFAQLSQLAKEMNGDWVANWDDNNIKFVIARSSEKLYIEQWCAKFYSIVFKTKEMAEFSLKHHEQLWKDYYELD